MAVLPLRNSVFFPRQVMPLTVGREGSIKAIEEASQGRRPVGRSLPRPTSRSRNPTEKDMYWVGTLAKVLKSFTLADGTRSILVQGMRRVRIISILQSDPFLRAVVRDVEETNAGGRGNRCDGRRI